MTKKLVDVFVRDVFVRDRLVASYPVVVQPLAGAPAPTDGDFVELLRVQMQGTSSCSLEDIAAAKFEVRGLLD